MQFLFCAPHQSETSQTVSLEVRKKMVKVHNFRTIMKTWICGKQSEKQSEVSLGTASSLNYEIDPILGGRMSFNI